MNINQINKQISNLKKQLNKTNDFKLFAQIRSDLRQLENELKEIINKIKIRNNEQNKY